MKFSAIILAFLLILSFASSNFSQNSGKPGTVKSESVKSDAVKSETEDIWTKRITQVKYDILEEIKVLPNKEQAEYYGRFGNTFLYKNKKEAEIWIGKALEIAFNPATEYKDNQEKIKVIFGILVFHQVLENEEALFKKPLAEIVKILHQEVNEKQSDEYGNILINLARNLLKKDENLAVDLAILSLKGNKPVFNWTSYQFLTESKKKNEALSERYFAKMLDVVKMSGKTENLYGLLRVVFQMPFTSEIRPENVSERQKKDLLELLIPYIQNESEELLQKKRDNCSLTKSYGKRFLEDYKKLLPQSAGFVEQAINICRMSPIEFWKKPDFEPKTSQDYLDLAEQMSDKLQRINYIMTAASRAAHNEKNYRFAIEILDGIDEESKKLAPHIAYSWQTERLQSSSEFVRGLINQEKFAEIKQFLESSPPNLRPFIVIRAVIHYAGNKDPKKKQFLFNLLNEAKTELFKMEIPVSPPNIFSTLTSLGSVQSLVKFYCDFGFQNEAIEVHEGLINFMNRAHNRLVSEKSDVYPYFSYFPQSLPKNFIETYFEQIYQNTGKIKNPRFRLDYRINLLRETINYFQNVPNTKSNAIPIPKSNK